MPASALYREAIFMAAIPSTSDNRVRPSRVTTWTGIAIAIALPVLVTWVHFVGAGGKRQAAAYVVMQIVQFALPLGWLWMVEGGRIEWGSPRYRGVGWGIAFGVAVIISAWVLFHRVLAHQPFFTPAIDRMREKALDLGLMSPARYAAFGLFYTLIHSFLEEYYWRWFVFARLRWLVRLWPAIVVSALGFTLHHVVLVGTFSDWALWSTLAFSAMVPIAGGFWAWLYDYAGSLAVPWISHALVDAGIVIVGYDLVRHIWAN